MHITTSIKPDGTIELESILVRLGGDGWGLEGIYKIY